MQKNELLLLKHLRTRLYLPRKPALTETSLSDRDYCELSTKFKACHIKIMVFWVAKKTQEVADENPHDARLDYDVFFLNGAHKMVSAHTTKTSLYDIIFKGLRPSSNLSLSI